MINWKYLLILLAILLALGGYYYLSPDSQPSPEADEQTYLWSVDMNQMQHIAIRLPRDDMSAAFRKGDDRQWYFDNEERTGVDIKRWGGGIPFILEGPAANKIIAREAPPEKLDAFGLGKPSMTISLTLEGGNVLDIAVGDMTPDGQAAYIIIPGSGSDVATVDASWYEVLRRLVTDPPLPAPDP